VESNSALVAKVEAGLKGCFLPWRAKSRNSDTLQ